MNRIITILALVSLAAAPLDGQTIFRHTIPAGFETVDGTYSLPQGTPFNTAAQSRWQWTYARETLTHQFPITIFELSFRRSSAAATTAATYQGVQIILASSASASHTSVSPTFANNLAADQTVVYSGDITIPAYTPPAPAPIPAPFNLTVVLQTPFTFDPIAGLDLVVDVSTLGATPGAGGNFPLDGIFPSDFVSQNGHVSNPLSPTSNWPNPDAGPIIELGYVFGSPNHFDLLLSTSGGGSGDLSYVLANIPAGAVEGYTLVSGTPVATFGIELGLGPILGIWFDPLTLAVLMEPAAAGSPFHWTLPVTAPTFPAQGLFLPPGSITGVSGLTWEAVSVALNGSGQVVGATPVRQLVW